MPSTEHRIFFCVYGADIVRGKDPDVISYLFIIGIDFLTKQAHDKDRSFAQGSKNKRWSSSLWKFDQTKLIDDGRIPNPKGGFFFAHKT